MMDHYYPNTVRLGMNYDIVKRIADAVLYEGYILYPYRASAIKNQHRFNFGTLYPRSYSDAGGGGEPWSLSTECLVRGTQPTVEFHVRFLQLIDRQIARLASPLTELPWDGETSSEAVDVLHVGNQSYHAWQEACEREVVTPERTIQEIVAQDREFSFEFSARQDREPIRDADGRVVGLIVRQQPPVAGAIKVAAEAIDPGVFKLKLSVSNATSLEDAAAERRDDALLHSFPSAHVVLMVRDGEFASLLDPPDELRTAALGCQNVGVWPVLAGDETRRDMMLASPIILYDYPQIAPESAGDFCDGTEIDEMLALRVLTLTDDEKDEMRCLDDRSRAILERTQSLPQEHFLKLHGAVRGSKAAQP